MTDMKIHSRFMNDTGTKSGKKPFSAHSACVKYVLSTTTVTSVASVFFIDLKMCLVMLDNDWLSRDFFWLSESASQKHVYCDAFSVETDKQCLRRYYCIDVGYLNPLMKS